MGSKLWCIVGSSRGTYLQSSPQGYVCNSDILLPLIYTGTNISRSCFPIGIGLEFVRQLLARGDQVIAAVRDPMSASELWQLTANSNRPGACEIHQCDVKSEQSIDVSFITDECRAQRMEVLILTGLRHPTRTSAEAWHRLFSAQRRRSGLS